MNVSEPTVYIDFLCPWAYRGSMWLADVEKAGRIHPTYRFFSLSQNHATREGAPAAPIWERDPGAKGLPAFIAATAARAQGEAAGNRFRLALQRARHEDRLPVDQATTHRLAAERAVALYDAIETVHRFGEVIEIKTPESEGTLAA